MKRKSIVHCQIIMWVAFIVVGPAYGAQEKGASDYSSVEEYLKVPAHRDKLEFVRSYGIIEKGKKDIVEGCDDKKKNIDGFCDCFTNKFSQVSDEEFFFDLMKIEDIQKQYSKVIINGNKQKIDQFVERLRKDTISYKIEESCKSKLKER